MNRNAIDNIKLGLFVIIGLFFMVGSLYLIGKNRNIFGTTTTISASFSNVQGLMAGNNVRFSGINVGTVKSVEILNDSVINVIMSIQKNARPYIRKNAVASVGTDGLMGNKLVNIMPVSGMADIIEEGDILISKQAVETDEMIRTLEQTNKNLQVITSDIMKITEKVINSNTLWSLSTDPEVANNVKAAIENIHIVTSNSVQISISLNELIEEAKEGKGLTGYLISDENAPQQIANSIEQLNEVSKQAGNITKNLEEIMQGINNGEGALGTLLNDQQLAENLLRTLENIEKGSASFNENMEALQHNFLLRRYFKKQGKKRNND
ncbi:MAG TPA: MlaD family protein [Cyclobacteriaceae bacterium]|nr:MlaD family protein [Cyclobacteriaceae bacterium]